MLSADTRIIINELRDHIHELDRAYTNGLPSAPEESLDSLVTSLLALSGLNHESMLCGLDWTFQEIGRRTERAANRHLATLGINQTLVFYFSTTDSRIGFIERRSPYFFPSPLP